MALSKVAEEALEEYTNELPDDYDPDYYGGLRDGIELGIELTLAQAHNKILEQKTRYPDIAYEWPLVEDIIDAVKKVLLINDS